MSKPKRNTNSKLSHHEYKKGSLITPLNQLSYEFNYWNNDRLPEYLWLGLIFMNYDRRTGFEKTISILQGITDMLNGDKPKLSEIFSLSAEYQNKIYEIICDIINPEFLSPLTALYRNTEFPLFNKHFNCPVFNINYKIEKLSKAIKLFYDHQSNEATDLKFIIFYMMILKQKIKFSSDTKGTIEAIKNYIHTNHDDKKMGQYRSFIRTLEMGTQQMNGNKEHNKDFIDNFWKEIGMKTPCNLFTFNFDSNDNTDAHTLFVKKSQKSLRYLLSNNKNESIKSDKFHVITGSYIYALKIFNEINSNSLGNSILGRHALRTVAEVYIMIKYLLNQESGNADIWREYKFYGIQKYKLVLLKSREKKLDYLSHFIEPVINEIVNEIRSEEYINIDFKYFDNKTIRKKSEIVGEKDLYDILYDYDTNFSHGLWGAVRESSMLMCDNPTHKYHTLPDIEFNQKMPDISNDSYDVINKFFDMILSIYPVPKSVFKEYE